MNSRPDYKIKYTLYGTRRVREFRGKNLKDIDFEKICEE